MKQQMQMIGQDASDIHYNHSSMFMDSAAFTNKETMEALHLGVLFDKESLFFITFSVMKATGDVVFRNLLFFSIGVAFGTAKRERLGGILRRRVLYVDAFHPQHATDAARAERTNHYGKLVYQPAPP